MTRFLYLLEGYLSATLNRSELAEFLEQVPHQEDQLKMLMNELLTSGQSGGAQDLVREERIYGQLLRAREAAVAADLKPAGGLPAPASLAPVHRVHLLKTAWFRYAAAIILVLATGVYIWIQNSRVEQSFARNNQQLPADIQPGKDGAILTLADGARLALDSLADGIIAQENGSEILLLDGKMSYTKAGAGAAGLVYHTMSTPKGRQYQFKLPDGTGVWLNSESSIRYPTAFNGNNRKVEVKGELYFDVSPNPQKPFIVETDLMDVEVLGTEFNVNCYDNEAYAQTTLINGLVKLVSKAGNSTTSYKLLQPGRQAVISREGSDTDPVISNATNIDQVIAWKEGMFDFDKVDLFNLMRQLERWYNIEVEYRGDIKNIKFRGKMYRNVNLSYVLNGLKRMGVSFEQEGNKLIIISTNKQ